MHTTKTDGGSKMYLKDIFISHLLKHGYRPMWACSCIWMDVRKMHPPRLAMGPFVLKLKCALHRMNMGDEHHWWCQRISFHDLIWQAKRNPWRRTLSLQRWAFYCKVWNPCPDDLTIPRRLVITYTWRVLFQLEASSWLVDHFDGCWHDAHNQSKDNSQKNPGKKIFNDESSNTTLGGRVELDKQREQ